MKHYPRQVGQLSKFSLHPPSFSLFSDNLGIQTTNIRYGSANIATSKIVYFHGSIDPWHVLGKLKTTDDVGDKVIIVEGIKNFRVVKSHCNLIIY